MDDTKFWRGVKTQEDCEALKTDLRSVYSWAESLNMIFNSSKFEWVRYVINQSTTPNFQYLSTDGTNIGRKENLHDLGVRLSSDLTFSLQIEKVVTTASQMVGWGLRTFRGRSSLLLLTIMRSIVQPHLDYCSQLWSSSNQSNITKLDTIMRTKTRMHSTEHTDVLMQDKGTNQ